VRYQEIGESSAERSVKTSESPFHGSSPTDKGRFRIEVHLQSGKSIKELAATHGIF
jgi:hypothetical protein